MAEARHCYRCPEQVLEYDEDFGVYLCTSCSLCGDSELLDELAAEHAVFKALTSKVVLLEQLDRHIGEGFAARTAAERRHDWTRYTELTVILREMLEARAKLAPHDDTAAARDALLRNEEQAR